ncbi:MAG: hypothetical protein FWD22_01980 [Treponema sp.]|nr:hypothetical protein [Treponema sp.]
MNNKCVFFLLLTACFLSIGTSLSAFDFSFRPNGFVSIPAGDGNEAEDGNERYSMGGGGGLGFEIDLSTIWPNPLGLGYTFGIEGGLLINPMQGDNALNVSFYSFGGAAGLYFFPLSRLLIRADGAVGLYQSALEDTVSSAGMFLRYGGELGFRFTPGFLVAANMGWRQYHEDSGSSPLFNSGMYAGLTAQLSFRTGAGTGREGAGAVLDQYGAVYPAFMRLYQTSPIGTITIRNTENAEIRDVRLYFRAAGYTASEFLCGSVSIIPRGRNAQLPLFADFSSAVLRFSDRGRILGELVIRYRFLGEEREVVRAVTVAVNNRNMVSSNDATALASFISPTSPEVLDYARFVAGLARANPRIGHNENMQFAIWLFESLRAAGIRLGETYTGEGEVQFPAETLAFGTGDSRDLAILFAAGLESVGIQSAFIQTDDDLLVAVSLDTTQRGAETLFNGLSRILVVDDNAWLPLSMKSFNNGFTAAWTQGASIITRAFESDGADFVTMEYAWGVYPPAPLPEQGRNVLHTDAAAATREVNRVYQQYIEQELNPLVRQVQAQITARPTAALHNRLGMVLVRVGRTADAKASYERAAGMGLVSAMNNRGNLALAERDFAGAERWFRQALARDSSNAAALRGMELVQESR